jgi:hypothetical protein
VARADFALVVEAPGRPGAARIVDDPQLTGSGKTPFRASREPGCPSEYRVGLQGVADDLVHQDATDPGGENDPTVAGGKRFNRQPGLGAGGHRLRQPFQDRLDGLRSVRMEHGLGDRPADAVPTGQVGLHPHAPPATQV